MAVYYAHAQYCLDRLKSHYSLFARSCLLFKKIIPEHYLAQAWGEGDTTGSFDVCILQFPLITVHVIVCWYHN